MRDHLVNRFSKPEAPAQNEKKLSKSKVDDKAKKVKLKIEEKQPKNKQAPLKVEAKLETKKAQEKVKPVKKEYFRGMELPANYKSISIFGNSVATKGQAVNLIKANGNEVKLDCSIEDIVNLYWVEAERGCILIKDLSPPHVVVADIH